MENFLKLLQKTVLPDEKKLGGFFIGEKVLFCASKGKLVYLCADFVTASKLKKEEKMRMKKTSIFSPLQEAFLTF